MQNVWNLSFSSGIAKKQRFRRQFTFCVANLIFGAESLDRSEAPEIEVFRQSRCISHRKRWTSRFAREIAANHAKRLKSKLFFRNPGEATFSATIYVLRRKLNVRSGIAKSERRAWNQSFQVESLQIGRGEIAWDTATKTSKIKLFEQIE